MSDDQPVPDTLQSIAEQIRAMDARFDGLDARITKEIADAKSQLRTDIEAVRDDISIVAEGLAAQTVMLERSLKEHETLGKRVDDHDVRILALEKKQA